MTPNHIHPRLAALSLLLLFGCVSPCLAQTPHHDKIFGGYFEEWGIFYGGYTIADLQKSGVADELTHLIYALAM
jgi:chitinase